MLGACQFKLLAPKTPGERKEREGFSPYPLLSLPYAETKKRRRGWKSVKNTFSNVREHLSIIETLKECAFSATTLS